MKITVKKLQKLIRESLGQGDNNIAKKLAEQFKIAGENQADIRNVFELAVTLGHAMEGTLRIRDLEEEITDFYKPMGKKGIEIYFEASPRLKFQMQKLIHKSRSDQVSMNPSMYPFAYF